MIDRISILVLPYSYKISKDTMLCAELNGAIGYKLELVASNKLQMELERMNIGSKVYKLTVNSFLFIIFG